MLIAATSTSKSGSWRRAHSSHSLRHTSQERQAIHKCIPPLTHEATHLVVVLAEVGLAALETKENCYLHAVSLVSVCGTVGEGSGSIVAHAEVVENSEETYRVHHLMHKLM